MLPRLVQLAFYIRILHISLHGICDRVVSVGLDACHVTGALPGPQHRLVAFGPILDEVLNSWFARERNGLDTQR